jgi:hypothetical protein
LRSWEKKYDDLKPGQLFQATKPFYETTPIRVFKAKTPIMVIGKDYIGLHYNDSKVYYLVEDIKSSMDAYNFFICFEEMKQ